jgi:hypothetical protein
VESETAEECSTARDCAYGTMQSVVSEQDCACPVCPAQAPAVPRKLQEERRASFREVCHIWARSNACVPGVCAKPPALECNQGRCELASEEPNG